MQEQGPASKLRPLPADLQPEVRDLAIFLRARYDEFGLGVRALGRLYPWDASEISRYLHGRRIPDPDFIRRLAADSANAPVAEQQQSRKPVAELEAQGLELRFKALQVRNKRQAEVEGLRQELADTEHEMHLADVRERALTEQLSAREAEAETLLERVHALENEQKMLRPGPRAIEQSRERKELDLRRSSVEVELTDLRHELEIERGKRTDAEQRRDELQEKLDEANQQLAAAGGPAGDLSLKSDKSGEVGNLNDKAVRWGGVSGLIAVPSITYAGPTYFGIIYGLLPAGAVFLRSITLVGPIISACFVYRERKDDYAYGSTSAPQLLGLVITAIALFTAGFLIGHFGRFIQSF